MMRLKTNLGVLLIGVGIALMFSSLSMMYEISFWRVEDWYDFPFQIARWNKWQAYDFWFLMNLTSYVFGSVGGMLVGIKRGRKK